MIEFNGLICVLFVAGVLLCIDFIPWMQHVAPNIQFALWTDCKLYYFCWHFFRELSSALLVIMSVEKVIALYFPFKTKNMCTVKRAKQATAITIVIFAVFNSQFFFTVKAGGLYCIPVNMPPSYILIQLTLDTVLYSYGPIAIMGAANIAIIYKFVEAKLQHRHGRTESTNQALSNAAMRGTSVLIGVFLMFIVLTGPHTVAFAIPNVPHPILRAVVFPLMSLNHAVNGLVYSVVGTKFRRELMKTLCSFKQSHHNQSRETSKSHLDSSITSTAITSVKV